MKVNALVGIAALVSCPSFGQTAATPLSFEVASVKLVNTTDGVPAAAFAGLRRSSGRLTWTTTPTPLVCYAFGLPEWRVLGIKQIQSFYSIDATMDTSTTDDQVRLMLQKVLVDRFELVAHRETKELQGYALVIAKNGPKIKSAAVLGEAPRMPEYLKGKAPAGLEGRIFVSREGDGISALTGRGVSLSQLVNTLSETLGTFVMDRTGMTGKYYFGFKFLKDIGSSEVEVPTLFRALQEELGLKLEQQRGPVEVLVVDHMEKIPTEN